MLIILGLFFKTFLVGNYQWFITQVTPSKGLFNTRTSVTVTFSQSFNADINSSMVIIKDSKYSI